ncbi:40S ribosomal protein S3a-like [Sorex fumeus]|uniref:40S ribosomal protein S3a-like n=1 Tax=Sorex fumeus TaxID=62283 RepID=UPI0024ADA1EA|nr:40S ribosomal protein S3a-like [Sorex fumeus]
MSLKTCTADAGFGTVMILSNGVDNTMSSCVDIIMTLTDEKAGTMEIKDTLAVSKNKHLTKGIKKGVKKKVVDPFSKKDWYDVKAPAIFNIRNTEKKLVTRTQGTKIASDGLKGRVFEVSLADLQNDEVAFRKFKLITEDVQGKTCLTNFHGMDLTRDKMCSMVKKWQTMIEAHVDVKTTDGYLLRLFCVGFTKKCNNQIRKTSYAQHQQVRQIQKKMMEIMTREVQTNDLKEVVNKLIPDSIGKDIEKACQSIYPLHDVFVRKVKMLKKLKFELGKLMELHGEGSSSGKATGDETGVKVKGLMGMNQQSKNLFKIHMFIGNK